MRRRRSLRGRLVLGLVSLAAFALLAADIATYISLNSFLVVRVDNTLEVGHAQVEHQALDPDDIGHGSDPPVKSAKGNGDDAPPAGINWYEIRTSSNKVLASGFLVGGGSAPELPRYVPTPTRIDRSDPVHERVEYFTVSSKNDSTKYRIRASIDPREPNRMLLVAASLGGVIATLHRLLMIELLVTVAVLAALTGLGFWVVRIGLRPLRSIERTAATIAAGDLSGRIDRSDPRTEIGRLGMSLNTMLGQIEAGFAARQESEARLREFVADASHELRTPLAAVRAYAELFGRGAATRPEDLSRSMAGISREAERMSLLVEELLTLARLDEGRGTVRRPLDLAAVATEAVDAARVLEPDRPISVSLAPAWVLGDHHQLRQIIDNLLANVRVHTPHGTPVAVSTRQLEQRAELRVTDHGPGLSDEQAKKVFERFFRADSSRARASGGSGLGLSIVAAIAEAHGGTARAEPSPGGGASFVVSIPLIAER